MSYEAYEFDGTFLPSRLAAELRDADIPVAGVTATEDDDGAVTAVQVIVDWPDDAKPDTATIKRVVKAHDPTPAPDEPGIDPQHALTADAVTAALRVALPDMTDAQAADVTQAALDTLQGAANAEPATATRGRRGRAQEK